MSQTIERAPLPDGSPGWQSWRKQAACQNSDPEIFFGGGITSYRAKQICASCPVRDKCLAQALVAEEGFGIWGGMTRDERSRLKRRMAQQRAAQRQVDGAPAGRSGIAQRTAAG